MTTPGILLPTTSTLLAWSSPMMNRSPSITWVLTLPASASRGSR